MRAIKLIGIMMVMAIGWSGMASAEDVKFSETYEAVMKTLGELKPDQTVKLVIGTQKKNYTFNESLEARFQADQPCYMTLMDISTSGDISFLAPSKFFANTQLEGKRVYSTSTDFGLKINVSEPEGVETLNMFCTREKFDFFEADLEKEDVYTIPKDDAVRLEQLQRRLEQLNDQEWSGATTIFGITKEKDTKLVPENGARGSQNVKKRGIVAPIDATGSTGRMLWPVDATGSAGHTEDDKPKSNE